MNAMIIYDDANYAGKAKVMFESAAHHADQALTWAVKPWSLEMLHSPKVGDLALTDAADAHLILFGLRDPRNVPEWLQSWLEQWAADRQIPDAALAVLGGEHGDLLSATDVPELSQFADRNGLSLIFSDLEAEESHPVRVDHTSREIEHEDDLPAISRVYHAPSAIFYYGCGINE